MSAKTVGEMIAIFFIHEAVILVCAMIAS